jgi:hypothetical protein
MKSVSGLTSPERTKKSRKLVLFFMAQPLLRSSAGGEIISEETPPEQIEKIRCSKRGLLGGKLLVVTP